MSPASHHTVVMVTSSYPRFPGDNVGSFVEPIAKGVAARGHRVHLVAPWHPRIARPASEDGVDYHFFKYAPVPALNVFGYAGALKADVQLRAAAWMAAPLALAAGWREAARVARRVGATVVHAHWVIPGGAIAALAAGERGFVVSLHGSDVYVAETSALAGRVARAVFARAGWVTACSADLRQRALRLGAVGERTEVVPYGVDSTRFRPDPATRRAVRHELGIDESAPVVATAGRFVRKKGFEYLVAALPAVLAVHPGAVLVLGGDGELEAEYRALADRLGVAGAVRFPGMLRQDDVGRLFASADVLAVPSVRDASGNVDGLPNVVMEGLSAGTPLVATPAGGIASVVENGRNGLLVPEHDTAALSGALLQILDSPELGRKLGAAARQDAERRFGWDGVAARFEAAYGAASHRTREPQRNMLR